MRCLVEIWALTDETPRGAEVIATYHIEEAPTLLAARLIAHQKYTDEHPGETRDLVVYGRAKGQKEA